MTKFKLYAQKFGLNIIISNSKLYTEILFNL